MNRFAQLALALFALCLTAACGEVTDLLPEVGGEALEVPTARCAADGVPVIDSFESHWSPEQPGSIEVVIRGASCGATVSGFDFSIYNAAGHDITGRSWPEPEAPVQGHGRFEVRGLAAGCSDLTRGSLIEVWVRAEEGASASVTGDLEAPPAE